MLDPAELVLFVADDRTGITAADAALLAQFPSQLPVLRVLNKCDLSAHATGPVADAPGTLRIAAATGDGLDALAEAICAQAGFASEADRGDAFTARRRHLDALRIAGEHVARAAAQRTRPAELIAEELRLAQLALEAITGRYTADDLLGRIFGSFCIGK